MISQSNPKPVPAERLVGAEPQLFVADVAAAADFYAQRLGFRVAWLYGAPAYYGQVVRDSVKLNLRCVTPPPIAPALRDRETLLSASITLATRADLETLAAEYENAGITFFQDPTVQPWDAVNFIIRDLDGNLLLFASPL